MTQRSAQRFAIIAAVVAAVLLLLWLLRPPPLPGRAGELAAAARRLVFGRHGIEAAHRFAGGTFSATPGATESTRGAEAGPTAPIHPEAHPDPDSESDADRETESVPPPRSVGALQVPQGPLTQTDLPRVGPAGRGEPHVEVGDDPEAPQREREETELANPIAETAPEAPAESNLSVEARPIRPPPNATARATARTNVAYLTEEFGRRLRQAGARSGEIQISLMWNNVNDLDLHCVDPYGEEIYFHHRQSRSGGLLDVDMNAVPPLTERPVENVYWPARTAPAGRYTIHVNHYRNHGAPDPTSFVLRVLVKGQLTQLAGTISSGNPKRQMHQFVLEPTAGR